MFHLLLEMHVRKKIWVWYVKLPKDVKFNFDI